ncbi:hypothetical protein [Cohnella fermenti]|uniref:Uncharacterized protein n=1 Tax=Cohnella fermenti TaxID=2565925 RepID=A0A4S4BJJ0_9BACL|nr:hypothetical protein [Cohnella fermenti]THF74817.1 hypothetical protein E6C55_23825 [Cohnella fermenti]
MKGEMKGWSRLRLMRRLNRRSNSGLDRRLNCKGSRGKFGDRGSVSVFFVLVLSGFVLFNGLLIDFARIAAFRKQAELAVMSGTRSVLAAYDPELYRRYGLFARGGDPADDLFRSALDGNRPNRAGGAFSLLDIEWSASAAVESRPLASYDVLRRQVMEEMKYKAPIDLSIELISRWRGVASAAKEAGEVVDRLEELRKAYERREASLDEAMKRIVEAGDALGQPLEAIVPLPAASLVGTRSAAVAVDLPDAVLMYTDYVSKRSADESRAAAYSAAYLAWEERKRAAEAEEKEFDEPPPPMEPPQYADVIRSYLDGVESVRRPLLKLDQAKERADGLLNQAQQAIEKAKLADQEMRRLADAEGTLASDGEAGMAEEGTDSGLWSAEESALRDESGAVYEQLRQSMKELTLGDEWFSGISEEVEKQRQDGDQYALASERMTETLAAIPGSSGLSARLVADGERLQSASESYRSAYGDSGSATQARRAMIEEHRASDAERKSLEQQAGEEWKQAAESLMTLTGSGGSGQQEDSQETKTFEQLDKLYQANKKWNAANDEAEERYGQSSELDDGREQALTKSGGWLSALTDAATGARDRLYGSEYVIARFSRIEPSDVREALAGQAELPSSPELSQTEYILYGFASAAGNVTAAYSEVLAARLSIRLVEGLVESGRYGNPLLVLAAATLYAVRAAAQDMQSLLTQGTIPLSKYASVATTYTDYLRLFLLLHGGTDNHWSRMAAVMEQESGLAFDRLYTYVSGQATASVTMWFFPRLASALGLSGGWGGTVNGDRYEATYQADDAYQ